MDPEPAAGPSPADDDALARYAAALADGIEAAIGPWVERVVAERMRAWCGAVPDDVAAAAARAGERATEEIAPVVRALLAADIDEQRSGPLALVRRAVAHPTEVLRAAGVPPVARDQFAARAFPEDVYDLSPATFADLDPALHEPGIVWGAAKAHVHLARRRAEGRR